MCASGVCKSGWVFVEWSTDCTFVSDFLSAVDIKTINIPIANVFGTDSHFFELSAVFVHSAMQSSLLNSNPINCDCFELCMLVSWRQIRFWGFVRTVLDFKQYRFEKCWAHCYWDQKLERDRPFGRVKTKWARIRKAKGAINRCNTKGRPTPWSLTWGPTAG